MIDGGGGGVCVRQRMHMSVVSQRSVWREANGP